MNVSRLLLGFALAGFASAAVGAEPVCAPVIEKAWVRAAPPGAPSLAGYLLLRNPCRTAVEVSDVESRDFGMPMIHRTEVVDGVSRMRPAGKLVVPPGGTLRFEPGGLHLMLMKPLRPMAEGDQAGVRLVLADGRRVFAVFPVRRTAP
ncbi:MAG TPA: copper chaperone PCu(A)C [Arenimonas sp.]|nr:copper chaperone PCu(A)C [Arenimonas sp.]